jgi:hypothetical protein
MKFRPPEILLGVLLAVAIFAMGFLFASSRLLPVQHAMLHQTAEPQSLWIPTDSVGLYTLVLAGFTALLVAVSAWQGHFLLRADKTARIAANAADLNARAVIALQLPLIAIQPASLGHGTHSDGQGRTESGSVHFIEIANRGQTRAFPKEVLYGWTIGNGPLPVEPSYRFLDRFPLNSVIDPNGTHRQFLTFECVLKPGQWTDICKGNYLWFYVDLIYDDFMGETRHQASCWRWAYIGMGVGWRPDEIPAYNRKI